MAKRPEQKMYGTQHSAITRKMRNPETSVTQEITARKRFARVSESHALGAGCSHVVTEAMKKESGKNLTADDEVLFFIARIPRV